MRALRACALACLAGFAFSTSPTQAEENGSAGLEDLRRAIGQSRGRVEQHERDERAVFDQLEELGRSLDRLKTEVVQARIAVASSREKIAAADEHLEVVSRQLERSHSALSVRAVALYKSGVAGPIELLFSATSLKGFLSQVSTLRTLVEYDAELVRRSRADYERWASARQEAANASADGARVAAEFDQRQQALEVERSKRETLLASVREDRVQERSLLVELERAARALEETLTALGDESEQRDDSLDGAGFAQLRGALRRPIEAEIARPFGKIVNAEFQTQTFRKGVELVAPVGDSVAAAARGQVRFAGWFRGYGKIVILDHGDEYFTVSGHLSEVGVGVGDQVKQGQVIGAVGETGTLAGPSLYFEIRKGSEPLDPSEWFASARR